MNEMRVRGHGRRCFFTILTFAENNYRKSIGTHRFQIFHSDSSILVFAEFPRSDVKLLIAFGLTYTLNLRQLISCHFLTNVTGFLVFSLIFFYCLRVKKLDFLANK